MLHFFSAESPGVLKLEQPEQNSCPCGREVLQSKKEFATLSATIQGSNITSVKLKRGDVSFLLFNFAFTFISLTSIWCKYDICAFIEI